ncbi:MAG: DUF4157 domain-containing protein [Phycisphaerales bacterium]|nr:DUF4157 domain-containing protein [Phycisphaerales bacterium]
MTNAWSETLKSVTLVLASLLLWTVAPAARADRVISTEHITISVTFHGADDMKPWAQKMLAVAARWYPRICLMLPSKGFVPPSHVLIEIDSKMKGVAYTTGTTVHLAAPYFRKHPADIGVIVHELTHVAQQYHHPEPGWLVEGLADYVRYYYYEPRARRPHINPAGHKYTEGYQLTAEFLHFIVQRYNQNFIRVLNARLRQGTYSEKLFKQMTGHTLAKLWSLYGKSFR